MCGRRVTAGPARQRLNWTYRRAGGWAADLPLERVSLSERSRSYLISESSGGRAAVTLLVPGAWPEAVATEQEDCEARGNHVQGHQAQDPGQGGQPPCRASAAHSGTTRQHRKRAAAAIAPRAMLGPGHPGCRLPLGTFSSSTMWWEAAGVSSVTPRSDEYGHGHYRQLSK
jgi:hypothetical protein